MQRHLRKRRAYRWPAYILLLCSVLLFYKFSGYEALIELRNIWRQEKLLEQEIEALREENAQIETAIKELGPDGTGVERIARQDLGWAKPGEIIVKVPEKR